MNKQGIFIATLLDHSGRAYSSSAVLRMEETSGSGKRFVKELGFLALVDEVEGRILCLAEALASGYIELFIRDTQWLSAMHAAHGVANDLLPELLAQLKVELMESLPERDGAMAARYIQAALDSEPLEVNGQAKESAATNSHQDLLNHFLLAVLESRPLDAEDLILEAMKGGSSAQDLHDLVLTPAQREIGEMWHRNEISVAEEHLGSRIVERTLSTIRARTPRQASTNKVVLLASVSGNLHDIGLRVVADHFEMLGWTPVFLGANMPTDDLASAVRDCQPDLVALSAVLSTHLRATANTINILRAERSDLPILVGGGPFALVKDLWKAVGADACALTAKQAVELGQQLTS